MAEVLKSLEQLQDAVDIVFDRITKRAALENERLIEISRRIRIAKAKVDAISGTKQAVTVFSTTKYPVSSPDDMDFHPLFGGEAGEEAPELNVELARRAWQENDTEGSLELFRFFMETSHERLNAVTKNDQVSADVSSLADLLLFKSSDLERKVEKPSTEEAQRNAFDLPPPPQSLTRSNNSVAPGLEEFGFKPTLRQVPLFSLPSRLPDLPMVADISWTGTRTDELPSIAPSATNKSPQKIVLQATMKDQSFHAQTQSPPTPAVEISPKKPVESHAPARESRGKEKAVAPPSPPPPPPPPLPARSPPPPPPLSKSPETTLNRPSSSSSSPPQAFPPPTDPGRAALLESIRSPNIKLKKTGFLDSSEKPSPSEDEHPKPTQQADLLAEMATTLKMRRMSMKGASHNVSKIPTSPGVHKAPLPIKNYQAFIPPADEDDSDDDDDWEE